MASQAKGAHAKGPKINRKALRQPDEFQALSAQAAAWAVANQRLLIGIGIAFLVIAIVAVVVGRFRAAQAAAAATEFRIAHTSFAGSRYAEAAEGFGTLAATYPSTPFGRLAVLYRAHALARKGDPQGAAVAYQEYLASADGEYLRQEALVGLGHAQEASGDAAGARATYAQAGDLAGPFRTDALLSTARLADAQGDGAAARAIYERLARESPDGDLKTFLEAKVPEAAAAATPQ
jgi:TolA-binding protein